MKTFYDKHDVSGTKYSEPAFMFHNANSFKKGEMFLGGKMVASVRMVKLRWLGKNYVSQKYYNSPLFNEFGFKTRTSVTQ